MKSILMFLRWSDEKVEDLRHWHMESAWVKTDNGYKLPRLAFGNLSTGDFNYQDYTVEFNVVFHEFTKWGNLRVMLRQNGLWDCYALTITKNGTEFMRMDGRWDIGISYGTYNSPLLIGVPYLFRAVVKGNLIEVYLNGEKIFSVEDPDNRYFVGSVLLRAELALFDITDLKLQEITMVEKEAAYKKIWEKAKVLNPEPTNPKPWKTVEEVGFNNMLLIYNGFYGNGDGEWDFLDALPLAAYLDKDMSIKDRMFDAGQLKS